MQIVEISLLVLAYTFLIVTLFLEIVCYKRNLESKETIFFTFSILLLIVSITYTNVINPQPLDGPTSLFNLISMLLVGVSTPLNVLDERQHSIPRLFNKILIASSASMLPLIFWRDYLNLQQFLDVLVPLFLGSSVIFSMLLIHRTKPKIRIIHREKIERIVASTFLILIPVTLLLNYVSELNDLGLKIGFTLPLVFILLAGSKLWDDINRLSLFKTKQNASEQNFLNYSFTNREKEVALLLIKGTTYKRISEELFISIPTVKSHVSNIYRKCSINNRIELITLLSH